MPISQIYWSFAGWNRDLHVLRGGTSPDLSAKALWFAPTTGPKILAADHMAAHPGDVTLTFIPLFKGTPNGDLFEGLGIRVNTKTGQVSVDPAVPPKVKHNFIVEVTAKNTGDGTTFTEVIRFQIHQALLRIWLTPDRLTVRPLIAAQPEYTYYRFTARAEFDDGTVGDVTLNHAVTWDPAPNFEGDGRFLLTAGASPGDDITVTATYPTVTGPKTASATIHVGQPWSSEPNIPKVGVVVGGGWPGTIKPEAVPNVLFLGDGFTAGDRAAFERVTNSFVHHVKTDPLTRPFDILATSMNFWRAFVPAPAPGISVRSEVYTFSQDGKTFAQPLVAPVKPQGADPWDIGNLVYVVGLPVPADKAKAASVLRGEWAGLVAPDPAPNLTDDLIAQWKAMADRSFIDEIDSFPGMSYGEPPAANSDLGYKLDLHEDRGGVRALRPFYRLLASETGVALDGPRPIGVVWAATDPSFHFDNTDLVVLVTSLPGGRAINATGYIAMSARSANVALPVTPIVGRKALRLDALPVPTDASADSCRTMTHELAHSFGAGDEYADFRARYQSQDDAFPSHANLQTEKSVKDALPGRFVADKIKWNWHRIRKAALIEGSITEAAGAFTIPLRLGHGTQFAQGDKVLLRVRIRGEALKAAPDTLKAAEILQVSAPPTSSSIVVRPVTAGSVTLAQLARFAPGSIVYLPTPAPASVSAVTPFAEMVGLNVKNAINGQNRPLTAAPCANSIGPDVQSPNLTGISLPGICFKHKPKIVGLYEGGSRYTCGVFHPTGCCMMRQDHDESAEFCAVCRYVIVDFINPFHHWTIDLDYAEIYPQG